MSTVTELLQQEFLVSAKPGTKIVCPFCTHETFSIKWNDEIGMCWHPHRQERMIAKRYDAAWRYSVSNVFESFYQKCHEHLLDYAGEDGQNPYNYLVQTRGLHPLVVADAYLGTVPHSLHVSAWFTPIIQEGQQYVHTLHVAQEGGRPSAKERQQLQRAEDAVVRVHKAQDLLVHAAQHYGGWLAFFYTDSAHRIVAIRFREPYTKNIRLVKVFPWTGVFGHGMFRPGQAPATLPLLVTEGEFNALQLHSAYLRFQEAQDSTDLAYTPIIAVGGVSGADYATIRRLCRTPILFYDHDTHHAGFGLVTGAQASMHVQAVTTPEVNTDPDAYIRALGQGSRAWQCVLELLAQAQWYYRMYDQVAQEIRQVRQHTEDKKPFEVADAVVDLLLRDLQERGTLFYDGAEAYLLLKETNTLLPISLDAGSAWRSLLHQYGINATETLFKYVSDAVYEHIKAHGQRTEVYHVACFNPQTFTLYLSNHANQMYKITRDAIALVDNGTDGILFQHHPTYEPWHLVETPSPPSLLHQYLLAPVNFAEDGDDGLTADEQRLVVLLWILATFFESLLPTKPLLLMHGEKGPGKTLGLRLFGRVIYGADFDVTGTPEKQETFDLDVARSSFLVLDNADTYKDWMEDRLAALATGAKYTRRVLYSTATMLELRPKCFVALTARTPKFRRDDIADRLLVLQLQRRTAFVAENTVLAAVQQVRDALMTALVSLLQYSVTVLQNYVDWDVTTTFRMADFAIFALKYARGNGTEDAMRTLLAKLAQAQKRFATELDPTCWLLEKWARMHPDRWVKSTDLCLGLTKIAAESNVQWHFAGQPAAFAQKWTQMQRDYAAFFVIGTKAERSRTTYYRVALQAQDGTERPPVDPRVRKALAQGYRTWEDQEDQDVVA